MLNLAEETKKFILSYVENEAPKEACGLLVEKEEGTVFIPSVNANPHPYRAFTIEAGSMTKVVELGKVVGVVHSHTETGTQDFSPADYRACNKGNLPWLMVKIPENTFNWIEPGTPVPLLERGWDWGISDCYTLIQDAYAEIGIKLNDYDRGELMVDGEFIWDVDDKWNLYEDNFKTEGFRELGDDEARQKYDLFLFNYRSVKGKINHAGLLWEVDTNIFYHHLLGRLSEASVYGRLPWGKMTVKTIRHRSLG